VTSTGLITCGAGIKHVTTGHTLQGLDACPSHVSQNLPFLFIAEATSGAFRCSANLKLA